MCLPENTHVIIPYYRTLIAAFRADTQVRPYKP